MAKGGLTPGHHAPDAGPRAEVPVPQPVEHVPCCAVPCSPCARVPPVPVPTLLPASVPARPLPAVQVNSRRSSCRGAFPQEASHRIRTTLYLRSFNCLFGEFWFTLGECVLSQPETVFVNLIKQRPLLGVKDESDSKPSRALGNSSIDCSRLGSILSSVKIL